MARRKIFLHGYLNGLCPQVVELVTDTVAEAINGLCKVTGRALHPNSGRGAHVIKVVGFDTAESLFAHSDIEELHIVPALFGGKSSSGFIQIAIGAVLVATAIFAPELIPFGISAGQLILAGAVMALGGLLQVLSPAPRMDTNGGGGNDPEASKYLAATQNTVKIGTRIPVLVGRFPVPGQYLSFNIDAKDVNFVAIPNTQPVYAEVLA